MDKKTLPKIGAQVYDQEGNLIGRVEDIKMVKNDILKNIRELIEDEPVDEIKESKTPIIDRNANQVSIKIPKYLSAKCRLDENSVFEMVFNPSKEKTLEEMEKSKFVIFLRNKDSNVIPHKVGKKQLKGKKSSSFDPRSEIIIKKLYQQGSGMSTNQLAKATQLPYLTVQRKLKKLKEYDAVVEEGENVEDNKGKEGKRGKTTRFSLNYSEIKNV